MDWLLSRRAAHLRELMEDPDCDPQRLRNTYAQFAAINRLFAQWKRIYRTLIRPELKQARSYTLLDVGCGGGDVAWALHRWAAADGFDLSVTAIDTDPRSMAYVRQKSRDGLSFAAGSTADCLRGGARFDFVISGHLIHHLENEELTALLHDAEQLARIRVIFNDIHRSPFAYLAFALITRPFFHRSFIVHDGLVSIRRSFKPRELRVCVGREWEVRRYFPYRLLLIRDVRQVE